MENDLILVTKKFLIRTNHILNLSIFCRIYLWSEFLEVMTSTSIEKSERSDVLTGNNEIKGFGHSNLEEQVQILEHMLSTIKGR